jgi:hypothetical protein
MLVSRVARIGLTGLALAGCFYTETVNQRPSLDIHRSNEGPYFRGGSEKIKLEAVSNDPEGHHVSFHWRAYACTEQNYCDQAPYFEKSDTYVEIPVPTTRVDVADPVKGIFIKLEGKDDFGAVARPIQELWVDVGNAPPDIVRLDAYSSYGFVVGLPVDVFAEVVDTDDRERVPDVTWTVYPNMPMNYDLVDISGEPSVGGHVFGKRFTPKVTGMFTFTFTASDGIVETPTEKTIDVTATVDKPPCLKTLSPLVVVAPAALPITDPTLFQVHVVDDDLDPYPASNDPLRGVAKFKWSLLAPGGTREVLSGVTGNSVAINPASYQPGDILELRVEIADRNNTPITCADTNATCSVISTSCLQRQTWRVEVR